MIRQIIYNGSVAAVTRFGLYFFFCFFHQKFLIAALSCFFLTLTRYSLGCHKNIYLYSEKTLSVLLFKRCWKKKNRVIPDVCISTKRGNQKKKTIGQPSSCLRRDLGISEVHLNAASVFFSEVQLQRPQCVCNRAVVCGPLSSRFLLSQSFVNFVLHVIVSV